MAQQQIRYNLRNYKAVRALDAEEEADHEEQGLCSDDSGEEFAVSDNEVSDNFTVDEQSDQEEHQKYDDDLKKEAENASKRKRLIDSSDRLQKRGRLRKSIPSTSSEIAWSEIQPDRCGSFLSSNPSPKGDALNIRSPLQAFHTLFSADLTEKIVNHTNENIAREIGRLTRERRIVQSYQSQTDSVEVNGLIGLLYYAAALKQNKSHTRDMWSEVFGCGIYRSVMSEQRFNFLILMLRFDDKTTRRHRQNSDKLASCREIWEIFIKNCVDNYEPSSECTIGEQLVGFRGKCSFRIYMENKPDKYGLKIFMLNDNQTYYMIHAIPYVGQVTPQANDSVPTYFVRQLVESLTGSWRTITMNNWFTSVPLFMLLRETYQLRAVGSIRKKEREIPSALKIVPYVPKKNKLVLLLSSLHHDDNIDPTSDKSQSKPTVIMYYNKTKDATDVFDRKCHALSVARRTRRWPLQFFYNMLNQASINSAVLYNLLAENPSLSRVKFLKELAFALIEPLLLRRLEQHTLRLSTRRLIAKVLGTDEPVAHGYTVIREESRAKCVLCDTESTGRTRMKCHNCLRRICDEHRCGLCIECAVGMD